MCVGSNYTRQRSCLSAAQVVRMEEECGECSFLTVELDMSSSFHRSSAELIRTNKSIWSSEPTVTILGLGWRQRRSLSLVCYV